LDIPQDWRIANLVADYANYPVDDLIEAFNRIGKRLGGQHVKAATEAVQVGDFTTAAAIALRYYDKAYQGSLEKNGQQPLFTLTPTDHHPAHQATQLLNAQRNWFKNKSET
jgi:tRNA 2-selenouridine synthase